MSVRNANSEAQKKTNPKFTQAELILTLTQGNNAQPRMSIAFSECDAK